MSSAKETEKKLRSLLRKRALSVDEKRLEEIRQGLLRRACQQRAAPARSFALRPRFALSFCVALLLVGFCTWHFFLRGDRSPLPVAPRLVGILEDERQLDQALMLLGAFAATPHPEGPAIDWEFYNRPVLGETSGEDLIYVLYGLS